MRRVVLLDADNPICRSHTTDSQAGVHQWDPPPPLVFSLAIDFLDAELASRGENGMPVHELDFILLYLDDGVVC